MVTEDGAGPVVELVADVAALARVHRLTDENGRHAGGQRMGDFARYDVIQALMLALGGSRLVVCPLCRRDGCTVWGPVW